MYIAFAICLVIIGLVLLRKISVTQTGKMKVIILIAGVIFLLGGGTLGWLLLSGRI